jgi:hypothetical protein
VSFIRPLHHDDRADHLGGHSDIEVQRFAVLGGREDRRVSCNIGSGVDRLYYFVFASSLFSYRVEGTLATTSLVRTL